MFPSASSKNLQIGILQFPATYQRTDFLGPASRITCLVLSKVFISQDTFIKEETNQETTNVCSFSPLDIRWKEKKRKEQYILPINKACVTYVPQTKQEKKKSPQSYQHH
jgi:hypothetical protein